MKREKLAESPWDSRALMVLLPKGDLTQLRFIREENPAVKSKPKLFTQQWAATKYLQDLLRLLLWVPSPWHLVLDHVAGPG